MSRKTSAISSAGVVDPPTALQQEGRAKTAALLTSRQNTSRLVYKCFSNFLITDINFLLTCLQNELVVFLARGTHNIGHSISLRTTATSPYKIQVQTLLTQLGAIIALTRNHCKMIIKAWMGNTAKRWINKQPMYVIP